LLHDGRNSPGFDVFDKIYDRVVFVNENNIQRKPHKKHVDGIAWGKQQSTPGMQTRLPHKAEKPGQETVGGFAAVCQNRVFRSVYYSHTFSL